MREVNFLISVAFPCSLKYGVCIRTQTPHSHPACLIGLDSHTFIITAIMAPKEIRFAGAEKSLHIRGNIRNSLRLWWVLTGAPLRAA